MTEGASAIYDLGYQHYHGARLGRRGAVRALYVHGLRALFGIGRDFRAKLAPIALILFTLVPALIQVAVVGLAGTQLQLFTHEGYFRTTLWIFGLFCAFQAPELVSSDQQYRVLALYFSRAITRTDYLIARAAALVSALFVVAILPHLLLLLGTWFAADDVGSAMHQTLPMIPRIIAACGAMALLFAAVSLAVAAWIPRRPFATAAILALLLVTSAVVVPLVMTRPEKMRDVVFVSPTVVGDGVATWIFDTTSTHDAFRPNVPPPDLPSPAGRRVRRRVMRSSSVLQTAGFPGAVYGGVMVVMLAAAIGVLTWRYRRIPT